LRLNGKTSESVKSLDVTASKYASESPSLRLSGSETNMPA